jgi:hypothetical protein
LRRARITHACTVLLYVSDSDIRGRTFLARTRTSPILTLEFGHGPVCRIAARSSASLGSVSRRHLFTLWASHHLIYKSQLGSFNSKDCLLFESRSLKTLFAVGKKSLLALFNAMRCMCVSRHGDHRAAAERPRLQPTFVTGRCENELMRSGLFLFHLIASSLLAKLIACPLHRQGSDSRQTDTT